MAAPATTLLVLVCAWKLATEFLFVTAGAYGAGFEVIERACAYAAPLALIWLGGIPVGGPRRPRCPRFEPWLSGYHVQVVVP